MTPLLEASQAAFHYPGREHAVGPFSLSVHGGELHHIRGPSGCGKSTFARMLAGLIPHLYHGTFSGAVQVDGQRTVDTPLWQLSGRVGLVGQNPAAQLLAATVRDEVLFGLENLGVSRAEMQTRLDATLDAFGLRSMADRDPHTLSGGEQQRLVLASIAARRPQVIILDEAFSMLDTRAAADIADHLQRLRREGTALLAFEHRLPQNGWREDARPHVLARAPLAEVSLPEWRRVAPWRLRVRNLAVTLGRRRVLEDIDLTLAGGRVVALLGANGAGKTTLLRALAGLQPFDGDIHDDSGGRHLGLCFQNPDQQIFNPTVRQEILFGNGGIDADLYGSALELSGLAPYEYTPPLLLSEGEKKRLALAILLTRPGLRGLCLDEPTLGQDDQHRRRIGRVVRHLAAAGYLCLVATHDVEWAAEWCDEFIRLHNGRIAAHRNATALRQPEDEERCHATV
ncbi:MAG TPA: ABC transporter ATP-binding protein [Candidatus Margulisiibacteriota bacterium]|nr:ABC transporter ATP-binding protein [Candidatus Margulisiibacteriota bacterium]